ncbi:MAG: hypothetical protein K9H58_08080 [Bacteroidales bacterium]|nr:hypothetical protein [Bacteroidales bacterium]
MKKSTRLSILLVILFLLPTLASFGVTNYWTGSFNTYWHNNNNWSLGHIPLSTEDVIITTSGYTPHVDIYDETCNSLNIYFGATLIIDDQTLTVTNTVTVNGNLTLANTLSKLYSSFITWNNASTGSMTGSSVISIARNWEFAAGANVQLNSGYVDFTGTIGSNIISKDIDCNFNHIRNFKSGTYLAHSSSSTTDVKINGNLYLYSGSILSSFTSLRIKLNGFLNNTAGTGAIQLNNGIFEFTGGSTTNFLNPGDYFYNLIINSTGITTIADDVIIKGYLSIVQGTFNTNSNLITIAGNWNNYAGPAGFTEGTGRVIFNGSGQQYVNYNENFNILEVNKTSGALRVNNATATINCTSYDWTAGAVDILQGTFNAASLADNGIAGSWYLNAGGEINLTNNTGYVDLLGNLYIFSGTMNIYGGIDDSYWPYGAAGSSITMSGGVLDFKETGIYVQASGTFTDNITGGFVKTTGNIRIARADFTPAIGVFTMYGTENATIRIDAGSLNQLDISKTSAKLSSPNIIISENLTLAEEEETGKEGDLPSPVVDEEYFSNNSAFPSYAKSQIIKKPRIGSSKAIAVTGDEVSAISNLDLTHLIVYSGTFNPIDHNVDLLGDMWIYDNLTITDTLGRIYVGQNMIWKSGSNDNVTNGHIVVSGNWTFSDGTNVHLGPLCTAFFAGTANQSIYCYDADASFGSVKISKPSTQCFLNNSSTDTMRVDGDFEIYTNNVFQVQNRHLLVNGEIDIQSSAVAYILSGGSITANSNLGVSGSLNNNGGDIYANDNTWLVGDLTIDAGTLTIPNEITTGVGGNLNILNDGIVQTQTIFIAGLGAINMTSGLIQLSGGFNAGSANTFQPTGGTVEFLTESIFGTVNMNSTNFFHDVKINSQYSYYNVKLNSNITIRSSLDILNGTLESNNYNILIGGSWTNNVGDAGFLEELGTVTFNGSATSVIQTDEIFYKLYCEKTGGAVLAIKFDQEVTVLNNLDVASGLMMAGSGSTMNVAGNQTIHNNAGLGFSSPGTILNIGGNWTNNNTSNTATTGFSCGNTSTVTFNGTSDQTLTTSAPFEGFYNLEINKPSGDLITNDNTEVAGNFLLQNGKFRGNTVGLMHTFYGDFTVELDGWWDASTNFNTVIFAGTADQNYSYYWLALGQLSNVIIDKSAKSNKSAIGSTGDENISSGNNIKSKGGTLNLISSMHLSGIESGLTINSGTLNVIDQTLESGGNITVNTGGILNVTGGSVVYVGNTKNLNVSGGLLNSYGTSTSRNYFYYAQIGGYYSIHVYNGGTIGAEYTDFRYMGANGLVIDSDGLIDPLYPLNNCSFLQGNQSNLVSYLTINNNQNLTIDSVKFDDGTITAKNVTKGVNQGDLLFTNANGYFAGPNFENDSYNRIDWTGFTPGLWTGSYSNDWGDYRNWDNLVVPDNPVDVIIPAGTIDPLISNTPKVCKSIVINAGASLTLHNNSLTVTNNVDIYGKLFMYDGLGVLNIGQNIIWRPGSETNVSAGNIIIGGNWNFMNGTNAQLGFGNTTTFNGGGDQYITCDDADAEIGTLVCNKSSGTLRTTTILTDTVRVSGNMTINAANYFNVETGNLILDGTMTIENTAQMVVVSGASFTNNSEFDLTGNLTVNGQAFLHKDFDVDLALGELTIAGSLFFNNPNPLSSVTIYGPLNLLSGGLLEIDSGLHLLNPIIIAENSRIRVTQIFSTGGVHPLGGTIEFFGSHSSNIYNYSDSYFYNVEINKTGAAGWVGLEDNIVIKNDLTINSGFLRASDVYGYTSYNIDIGGNWTNNVGIEGFQEAHGTVTFNGSGNPQYVSAETFYNVLQDFVSTGSNLLFLGSTTVLNNMTLSYYAWINDVFDIQGFLDLSNPTSIFTANNNGVATIANLAQGGTMNMNGGTVTVNDLAENGIYGSINVVSGELNYYQDASSFVDLNCNLSMSGGSFNINSSNDNSLWTYDGDASVTMSGGILNFNNCGIIIQDNANTFTANITGGTIRTDGMFKANCPQFTPIGGTIEMIGGVDVEIATAPGANLYNVLINKSGGKQTATTYKDRDGNMVKAVMGNMVNVISDISINGNLTVDAGQFYNYSHSIACLSNVTINNSGLLSIDANGSLALDNLKTLSVNSGGTLSLTGNAGNEAKITHMSGYYNLNIENGGTIAAEHGIFEYMHTDGIYLKPGSIVNPANPFNNCFFREGISGGRLMTINTENVFTVTDAKFPTNTWGSTHNVYKSAILGSAYFVGATGGFAGEAYEYDPYNLIHWSDHVLTLDLTINLEGPFNGTDMNSDLNNLNLLPLSQPYNAAPWNYTGSESVPTIPNNSIVDWVIVDGRDAPDAAAATVTSTFDRQAAFLLTDGSIVGIDGSSPIQFTHNLTDKLYVAIFHRNHLGILSAISLTEIAGVYTYDYTTAEVQVYGGALGYKELAPGIWGMVAGDVNADGIVDSSDKTIWHSQSGNKGYYKTDMNMEGEVNNQDKNDKWYPNIGIESQLPQ